VIAFTVPGTPVAKERPRLSNFGGFAHAYTPPKTVRFEKVVRNYAALAMAGQVAIDGPVAVEIRVFLPVPASWSRKRCAAALAGELYPVGRPDLDNYLKAILDGMNKVVITDDARVVGILSSKAYSVEPRVEVLVTPKEKAHDRHGLSELGVL